VTLNHDLRGAGKPLVLIHGIGHHWQGWLPLLEPLNEAGFQTLALDLPGFGASSPLAPSTSPTIAALADAVADFLQQRGWEHPHLVGNSMGGAIALELAATGRASSVTAISPVGFWSARERAFCQRSLRLTARLVSRWHAPVVRAAEHPLGRTLLTSQVFSRPWRIPPEQMRATIDALAGASAFSRALEAFTGYLVSDSAQLAQIPVTIAWGTRDRLLLPRQARRARAALPHARHISLVGCGHTPMWDDPQLLIRTITSATRR
jgi:pimeloyl-ACP methyl ester carboxylesterase